MEDSGSVFSDRWKTRTRSHSAYSRALNLRLSTQHISLPKNIFTVLTWMVGSKDVYTWNLTFLPLCKQTLCGEPWAMIGPHWRLDWSKPPYSRQTCHTHEVSGFVLLPSCIVATMHLLREAVCLFWTPAAQAAQKPPEKQGAPVSFRTFSGILWPDHLSFPGQLGYN